MEMLMILGRTVHSTRLLDSDSRAIYPKLYSVGVPIKFPWKRHVSAAKYGKLKDFTGDVAREGTD